MGNICASCCEEEKKNARAADDETSFQNEQGSDLTASILSEFDMTCSVFEGASVYQKFTSKHTYEPRFVWVNLETRTIHMSLYHNSKERRHKEASLADVTSVEKGGPKRVKNMEGNISSCLTVNFQRGGGIDLRFNTDTECDLWCTVLNEIVTHIKMSWENKLWRIWQMQTVLTRKFYFAQISKPSVRYIFPFIFRCSRFPF